jgi:CheY-like chemotaxis protein
VGKGSVFSVDLPIGDAKPQASRQDLVTPRLSAPLIGMRIVAVDNEPNILDGMRTLLEGWGCLVETAPGQGEALAACARLSGGPDAIIADYHLDRGTGVEVIDAIRAQYVGQLPAILVTADRSDAVRDLLRARDIVLMHKPLKPAGLRALLAQMRAARIPAAIASEPARTQDDQA